MKHRVIHNGLLLSILTYRIYLVVSNLERFIRYNGRGLYDPEMILLLSLPFIVIVMGFIANCVKSPIDIGINIGNCLLCCVAFFFEGVFWLAGEIGGSGVSPWDKPLINLLVGILAVSSICFSKHKYKKPAEPTTLNASTQRWWWRKY